MSFESFQSLSGSLGDKFALQRWRWQVERNIHIGAGVAIGMPSIVSGRVNDLIERGCLYLIYFLNFLDSSKLLQPLQNTVDNINCDAGRG